MPNSRYAENKKTVKIPRLSVKDTDFLLKLFFRSTFEGAELELAHTVLEKITDMHRTNLED